MNDAMRADADGSTRGWGFLRPPSFLDSWPVFGLLTAALIVGAVVASAAESRVGLGLALLAYGIHVLIWRDRIRRFVQPMMTSSWFNPMGFERFPVVLAAVAFIAVGVLILILALVDPEGVRWFGER